MSQVAFTEDRSVTAVLIFPQEIIDMIIDFLHHDAKSLQACALVSRSWLTSTRFHIFYSCTIKGAAQFTAAFRILAMTQDVGSYVRELTIVSQRMRGFTLGTFETLLGGLPHLRSLTIQRVTFKNNTRDIDGKNANFPRDMQRPTAPFALEELRLLECNVTKANYPLLFQVLGLFSSIQTLFLTSAETALWLQSDPEEDLHWGIEPAPQVHGLPHWEIIEPASPVHGVVVEHLHAFNIPPPALQALITTLIVAHAVRTLWYDDDTLFWPFRTWEPSPEVDRFGEMLAALPSRQHLRCLIIGPLRIFDSASELRLGLARLQLGSVRGLRTFHLRGRRLEPHLVDVFAALPDPVRDARFVLVGVSNNVTWGMSRNRFRAFVEAFAPALRKPERAKMSFILDLSIAKRKLPEEDFTTLRQRAEMGLLGHGSVGEGRMRIEDSPEET